MPRTVLDNNVQRKNIKIGNLVQNAKLNQTVRSDAWIFKWSEVRFIKVKLVCVAKKILYCINLALIVAKQLSMQIYFLKKIVFFFVKLTCKRKTWKLY